MLLAATARDDSPKNIRDAAIISLGFAGAFRRSELSALDIADLKWTVRSSEEILILDVRRSKTDQEAQSNDKTNNRISSYRHYYTNNRIQNSILGRLHLRLVALRGSITNAANNNHDH